MEAAQFLILTTGASQDSSAYALPVPVSEIAQRSSRPPASQINGS